MRFQRILTPAILLVCMALAVVASPTTAGAASPPSLPQPPQPKREPHGWRISSRRRAISHRSPIPGQPTLSATANGMLALASANTDPGVTATALSYMEANVDAYVSQNGADGPGQLALLILDAHALGADPNSFGGSDLVTRLLATQESTGKNAGLFGTKSQVNDFQAGVYDQGLALTALAAAGDVKGSPIKDCRVLVAQPAVCRRRLDHLRIEEQSLRRLACRFRRTGHQLDCTRHRRALRPGGPGWFCQQQCTCVPRPCPGHRRRLGLRAEHGIDPGLDRPRLDVARPPIHSRPRRLTVSETIHRPR